MSGKYYPNNWDVVASLEDDEIMPCTYEEFMDGLSMWALPSSHVCIMRVHNTDTGKVKEFCYQRQQAAVNKIVTLSDDPANVITIADSETIHLLIHPDNDAFDTTFGRTNHQGDDTGGD